MHINYYCYYPFLKGALSKYGHITSFNEQSILYAKDHIEKYSPTKLLELDLTVWLISTIILRNINNRYLTRKFVSNYSKLFEARCLHDFKGNRELRLEILDHFNIHKDIQLFIIYKVQFLRIHVMDYLEVLENGLSISAPGFKLTNQILEKGYVVMEYQKFVYLLRIALEQRLISRIKAMKLYSLNKTINESVSELAPKYPEFNLKKAPGKDNIPYSIQELIDKAYRDHNLNHRERIQLGIYLQSNNFDWDYIVDIYRQCTDFSLKTTTHQLNSLKRYTHKSN